MIYAEADNIDVVGRLAMASYMGFLMAIIIKTCSTQTLKSYRLVFEIAVPVFFCLTWWLYLPNDMEHASTVFLHRLPYVFIGWIIILHLIISFIPFISGGTDKDFWEYNKELFTAFAESSFFSFVLFIGLGVAVLAIDQLFDLRVDSDTYAYLFIALAGVFNSVYFFSKYPIPTYDNLIAPINRPYRVLVEYILIPIVIIYMLILYAYATKVGVAWELPQGWIAKLALSFSIAGLLTFLLNHNLPDISTNNNQNKLSKNYKKRFFLILIIPALLIIIAIYRRLSDYGVTENRYIIAIIGVWLCALIAYNLLSSKASIKWIPISLAAVILFGITAGPVGLFGSTITSQTKRLKSYLLSDKVLVNGNINKYTESSNPQRDWSILKDLSTRTDISFINSWTDNAFIIPDSINYNSHDKYNFLMDVLGVDNNWTITDGSYESLSYSATKEEKIDISLYSNMYPFTSNRVHTTNNDSTRTITIGLSENELKIRTPNTSEHTITGEELIKNWPQENYHQNLPQEILSYKFKIGESEMALYFHYIYLSKSNEKYTILDYDGFLLY